MLAALLDALLEPGPLAELDAVELGQVEERRHQVVQNLQLALVEHFYTADSAERDAVDAAGWNYEGVGWVAPVSSNTPVYRLYSGADHHYTTDKSERDWLVNDIGWKDEGIGWYSDDDKRVPLYRQFNPNVDPTAPNNNSGSRNYTVDKSENDFLVSVGWRGEGIGWYAMATSEAGLAALDGTFKVVKK